MPRIEMLIVRDPDGGTDVTLFVDGQFVVPDVEEIVDTGAGHQQSEWDEQTRTIESEPGYTTAFKDAVLEAREDPPGAQYMEQDTDDDEWGRVWV